jgi:hypothetical protein
MHALLSERVPLEFYIVNFQKMILQNGNNSNKIYFKVNTFLLPKNRFAMELIYVG